MGIKNIIGELRVNGKPVLTEKYSEGLAYELSDDETYYIVTGIGDCADTDIIIPSTYEGKPVTAIGSSAFERCTGLTSIVIPDSVTSIGNGAFYFCYGLTSIAIPDSVTSIGDAAFYMCDGLIDVYYTGSKEEWNNISIGSGNQPLTDATIHYNYADNFMSVNDRLGDVSSALDLLIAQTNTIIGGTE
jgi:hypothetical protein